MPYFTDHDILVYVRPLGKVVLWHSQSASTATLKNALHAKKLGFWQLSQSVLTRKRSTNRVVAYFCLGLACIVLHLR